MCKPLIQHASLALKASELNQNQRLWLAWHKIRWVSHDTQLVHSDAELSRDGTKINVYPAINDKAAPDQDFALMREFGKMIYQKVLNDEVRRRWELKLGLPTKTQIDAVQDKLKQRSYQSFDQMVKSFTASADRLVALNVANAFIANRQPIADCFNVDLRSWGPTMAYSKLERYHSIKPLVSAYAPQRFMTDFGEAFADCVVYRLRHVRESSVTAALKSIIVDICKQL
jgi:hypothetical protein